MSLASNQVNSQKYYKLSNSPIGEITIATNGNAITDVHIEGDRYFNGVPAHWRMNNHDPLLIQASSEIDEYFKGERTYFDVPLEMHGTAFQKDVWAAVNNIIFGSTGNYAEIARIIGNPKAVRAVGTAIGRNPICLIVPCHRVLTGTGALGGYVAGTNRKQFLLDLERGGVA